MPGADVVWGSEVIECADDEIQSKRSSGQGIEYDVLEALPMEDMHEDQPTTPANFGDVGETLKCHKCAKENALQRYCGSCGAPLSMDEYVALKVKDSLSDLDRGRGYLERDVAMRVFERVFTWVKISGIFFAIALLPLGGFGIYRLSSVFTAIEDAKTNIVSMAARTQDDLQRDGEEARNTLQQVASEAAQRIAKESETAAQSSHQFQSSVERARFDVLKGTADAQARVADLKLRIAGADALQQDVARMRAELQSATRDLREQQKLLENQSLFIKKVFSTYTTESFNLSRNAQKYIALPRNPTGALVFVLLKEPPIAETVQMQYRFAVQPRGAYTILDNLVVLRWGEAIERLAAYDMVVSYFPDRSSKKQYSTLTTRDGNVYLDNVRMNIAPIASPEKQ